MGGEGGGGGLEGAILSVITEKNHFSGINDPNYHRSLFPLTSLNSCYCGLESYRRCRSQLAEQCRVSSEEFRTSWLPKKTCEELRAIFDCNSIRHQALVTTLIVKLFASKIHPIFWQNLQNLEYW